MLILITVLLLSPITVLCGTTGTSSGTTATSLGPSTTHSGVISEQTSSGNTTTTTESGGGTTNGGQHITTPTSSPSPTETDYRDGGLSVAYTMTHFFLEKIVQTKQLNYLEENGIPLSSVMNDTKPIVESFTKKWNEWAKYFIGFAVCIIIGIITFILMCITGPCLCCCRCCCGNCGGDPDEVDGKNAGCARACMCVACMVHAAVRFNNRLSGEQSVFDAVGNGISGVGTYAENATEDIRKEAVGRFRVTADYVYARIERVPTDTFEQVDEATGITGNLTYLMEFALSLESVKNNMSNVNTAASYLEDLYNEMEPRLNGLMSNATFALGGCSNETACNQTLDVTLDLLNGKPNYTSINGNLSFPIITVQIALDKGIGEHFRQGYVQFENITSEINNTIQPELNNVKERINQAEGQINDAINNMRNEINKVDFNKIATDIREIKDKEGIKMAFNITFWATVIVPSVIGLIILAYLLGMTCGTCCERPRYNSTDCCTRSTGAHCLVFGVVLTFILYSIYMLLTIVMFTAGGATHTEACRHLTVLLDKQEVTESMKIIDRIAKSAIEKHSNLSLSVVDVCNECQNNTALYTALKLDKNGIFNITDAVDLEKRGVREVIENIKKINISLSPINLLNGTIREVSDSVEDQMRQIDYSGFENELNKNWTSISLTDYAKMLKETAETIGNGGIKEQLVYIAKQAEDIDKQILDSNFSALRNVGLESNLLLKKYTDNLQVKESTAAIIEMNQKINETVTPIAKRIINNTADDVYKNLLNQTKEIDYMVRNTLARCGRLHTIVQNTINSGCKGILYPLNAYWFAMGWCVFFFIPALILALKLVSLYRKYYEYGYEEPYDSYGQSTSYQTQPGDMQLRQIDGRHNYDYENPAFQQGYDAYKLPRNSPGRSDDYDYAHGMAKVLPTNPPAYTAEKPPMYRSNSGLDQRRESVNMYPSNPRQDPRRASRTAKTTM